MRDKSNAKEVTNMSDEIIPVGCIPPQPGLMGTPVDEVTTVFAIFVLVIQPGSWLQSRWKTTCKTISSSVTCRMTSAAGN